MSRNGDIEINVMDEKIRFLKMKLTEKKRQIELSLKTLPLKRGLDADLVVLQIQVGAIQICFSPSSNLVFRVVNK